MNLRRMAFVARKTLPRGLRVLMLRVLPGTVLRRDTLKLELGSGRSPSDGFLHCDGYLAPHIDFVFDLERRWIFPLACADTIRAYHLIEHFSHRSVQAIVARWVASLKPGGVLELKTPNFRWIAERYANSDVANFHDTYPWMKEFDLFGILFGGQENKYNIHKNAFDRERLESLLLSAGCSAVEVVAEDYELHVLGHKDAMGATTPRP